MKLFFCLLIILSTISGCSNVPSTKPNADLIQSTERLMPANGEKSNSFYGTWTVKKLLASAQITTHSDGDIQYLLNKEITYAADSVILYFGAALNNPFYKVYSVSEEQFLSENDSEITFKQLGIEAQSITEVLIYENEQSKSPWIGSGIEKNKMGWSFIVKDNDTLIMGNGGDYFELVRKS